MDRHTSTITKCKRKNVKNWGWETSAPVTSMDRYISTEAEEIKLDAQSSKTKLQKIQRWQRVEKQKTLKLKTQVFQLKQPHKKPGFPLTIGRIEHGTLEHPSARRAPYYPICYTCSWHSPPLLVSVATNCLNREGLEPKATEPDSSWIQNKV